MTTEPTLMPCPFCGGKAKITTKRRGNYRREGDNFQGLCNGCKARGPLVQDSVEEAAAAWNNRAAGAVAPQVPAGWVAVPRRANQQICQVMQEKLREWPRYPFRVAPVYEAAIRVAMMEARQL